LYDRGNLIKEQVDELHDLLSTGSVLTTMHAPYYGDSPNYPVELIVDTAHMGSLQWRLMEESISLASEFDAVSLWYIREKYQATGKIASGTWSKPQKTHR